jgi:hypothetical protein
VSPSFKAGAAAFLALATGPLGDLALFTRRVPAELPAFQGWERIKGDIEIESPRVAIQYEFFVNPLRPASYEVVRYRVVQLDAAEALRYPASEKLQWDRDGRDVRRFECVAEPRGGCAWREMDKAGKDYRLEVPVVLWLYGLHHRAIHESARPDSTHLASPCRLILPVAVG